jgi:hypothetical protein
MRCGFRHELSDSLRTSGAHRSRVKSALVSNKIDKEIDRQGMLDCGLFCKIPQEFFFLHTSSSRASYVLPLLGASPIAGLNYNDLSRE